MPPPAPEMGCKGCSPFPQGPSKLGSPLPDAEVLGKGLWSQRVNAMEWGDAETKAHTPGSTQGRGGWGSFWPSLG